MKLKAKIQKLQIYTNKHFPNLWLESRALLSLLTIIMTYLIITFMATYDYRHDENRDLLVIFYICDLLYIGDTIYRYILIRRQDLLESHKLNSRRKSRGRRLARLLPPSGTSLTLTSESRHIFKDCGKKCRYLFTKDCWIKYYTIFLDVLSILPLELFILAKSVTYLGNDEDYLKTFTFLKLNRLIRLYNIYFYYRRKTHELRLNLTRREVLAMLICFTSFLVILFSGIACTWYALSCKGKFSSSDEIICHTLGAEPNRNRTHHGGANVTSNGTTPRTLIARNHPDGQFESFEEHPFSKLLDRTDPWSIYVAGIHWSVSSLRNSGNRYGPPIKPAQHILAMCTQVFGFLMCTAITLVAIYVASQIDLKRSIFFHEAYGATTFVRHFKLGKRVTKFLNSCFNFMWSKNRGFTDHNIRPVLCKSMRNKILMCIFQPMVNASELLQCFSTDELERLATDVQYKHYFANEFIIRPNTIGHNIFYIIDGSVEIMSEEDPTLSIFTLQSGSLIGEVNIVYPTRRSYGVKTNTPSDILLLPFASVNNLNKLGTESLEQMSRIIQIRMNWVALQNDKKREKELKLVIQEQIEDKKRVSTASGGSESSSGSNSTQENGSRQPSMDPMEILLHRRHKSMSMNRDSDPQKSKRRKTSTDPGRMAAQFMSVLAWLNFYKRDGRLRKTKSRKYIDIYTNMQDKYRNPASLKMYKIAPTVSSAPKYIWQSLIISKASIVYKIWEFCIMIIILSYAVLYPIEILVADSSPNFTFNLNLFIELAYICDLVLRLCVFMDVNEIAPVPFTLKQHIRHEFRTVNIWFDVIAVLPIHHFASFQLRTNRDKIYSRILMYIFKSLKLLLFIKRWENNVVVSVTLVRLCKHFFLMVVFIVWLGSIFTYLGCPHYPICVFEPNETQITWVAKFLSNTTEYSTNNADEHQNFVYALPLAIFWSVCAVFGIQFDIASPSTRQEIALQTFGLLFGFAMITYFCADLAATLAGAVENKIHHVDKMIWLKRYMDDQLVDLVLISRVMKYMSIQWETLRGLNSDTTHTIGFLAVSHTMYTELVVHIVAECLFQTYFFQKMDTDLLRRFSLAATLVVIPPNEEIIKAFDIITRMYIIRKGYVQVYYGNTDIKMDLLTTGQSFGEVNMFYCVPSKVSLRSVTYVELILLDARAFEKILPLSKIHQDELSRLRADKKGLMKFDATIDSVVKDMSSSEIAARKYPEIAYYPSPFSRLKEQFKNVLTGDVVATSENTEALERRMEQEQQTCKGGSFLRKFLMSTTYIPNGEYLRWWENIRVFTICLIMFFVPIVEAYPPVKEKYQHHIYLLDLFTFADMYIRAHTAYYNFPSLELITYPLAKFKHYLASGFLLDLLASLPVYEILNTSFQGSSLDDSLFAYLMRLNRLILVYRIFGYYQYKNKISMFGRPIWKMVKWVPLFLYHAHIIGCCASVLACPSTMDKLNELRQNTNKTNSTNIRFINSTDIVCHNDSWVSSGKHPVADLTPYRLYIYSFYYVATTSIGCGFGDFKPSNESERYFATFLFFSYIFIITYILASVAERKSHIDYKLLRFQQHMKYLLGYIRQERLDSKLSRRIIRHYNYQWVRTKGIEPQKLFSNLFPALRKEVALDVFEDVFNETPELKGVSEGFLRAICVYMIPVYFLRHDIVVRKNDICDVIYFIFRGKVAANSYEGGDEAVLTAGAIIGILDPDLSSPVYNKTIISVTNVDLYGIPRKDFIRALKAFPDVARRFDARNLQEARELEILYKRLLRYKHRMQRSKRNKRKRSKKKKEMMKKKEKVVKVSLDSDEGSSSLQGEIHQEDTLSEVKYVYSDYAVSLVLEREDQDKSTVKYDEDTLYAQSILPESCFVKILTILVLLGSALSASLALYQASFESYEIPIFCLGYICDIVFVIKMCMGFRVSYFNDQGDVVVDTTEISNKYLSDSSGFMLDFLATFPFEVFAGIAAATNFGKDNNFEGTFFVWACLRLNRLARLIHVYRFYKRRASGLLVHLVPVKLERILMGTLLYVHFVSCLFYGITGYHFKRNCNCTNLHSIVKTHFNGTCEIDFDEPDVWFLTKGSAALTEGLTCHKYTLNLYLILATFTTTAYGDVYPVTDFEMLFISFLAFSSKVWLGFVLSDIISGVQNHTDLSYHLAADGVLKLYKDYGVTKDVLEKTVDYFTYAWGQNKGILFPEFLARAPASLKMDICSNVYGDHFRKSYLFRDLSESFVRQACIRLKPEWIMSGDYVIKQGEIDDKLYFIHHGIVEFSKEEILENNTSGGPGHKCTNLSHGFISRSKYFGEAQGILGPQHHVCSYKAETNVDVVSISHADIQELFHLFPECQTPIINRFSGRYSKEYNASKIISQKQANNKLVEIHSNTYNRNSGSMITITD